MPMACSKVFSGLVGVRLNMLAEATIVCNKVVVAASSHHRSPGPITRESQTRIAAKQTYSAIRDHFLEGET